MIIAAATITAIVGNHPESVFKLNNPSLDELTATDNCEVVVLAKLWFAALAQNGCCASDVFTYPLRAAQLCEYWSVAIPLIIVAPMPSINATMTKVIAISQRGKIFSLTGPSWRRFPIFLQN